MIQVPDPCAELDPCAPALPASFVPLHIGDDWGMGFLYADAKGVVKVLGTDTIEGQLFSPFQQTPLDLTIANKRVSVVASPSTTSFVLGLEAAVSKTLMPDADPPSSMLQIIRITATHKLTIAVIPLLLLVPQMPSPTIVMPVYTDPVTGDVVTFVGYNNLVPAP